MKLTERLQEAFDKRVVGTAMLPASDLLSAMKAIEQAEAANATLKEQVALYAGIDDEKACIAHLLDRANETIAQQADQIAGLIATNATLDAEWKKTTADKFAELVEAIRLKDGALIAVRDDLELRMQIAEDDSLNISNSVLDQMCDAIDLQPSPEILQARDERVAEACAKVAAPKVGIRYDDYNLTIRNGTVKALRSGEWRKYL